MRARMFFTIYFVIMLVGIGSCLCLGVYTKESLAFIDCEFSDSLDYIIVTIKNTGTTNLIFVEILLNHRAYMHDPNGLVVVSPRESKPIVISDHWSSRYYYKVTLITKRGNTFSISRTSPERQPPLEIENVIWNCTSNTVSVVVRNMGTRERKITDFGWGDAPDGMYLHATSYTDIGNGIYVPIDQTATIVFDWPTDWSPLIRDKTYWFCINTETGPKTMFTSRSP